MTRLPGDAVRPITQNVPIVVALVGVLVHLLSARSIAADTIRVTSALAVQLPDDYVETVIAPNPIEAALVEQKWERPRAHDRVKFPGVKEFEWREIRAGENGWFDDSILNMCYVYCAVDAERSEILLLSAMGDDMVYVNGDQRTGNPYGLKDHWESWEPRFDFSLLPIELHKGRNDFLLRCSRGRLKITLVSPAKPVLFNSRDATLPDFLAGRKIDTWGSIVLINSTSRQLSGMTIRATIGGGASQDVSVPLIQPLSVRKIAFRLAGQALSLESTANVMLSLLARGHSGGRVLDTVSVAVRVISPAANHKETFKSTIDGSVQYFAINPSLDTTRAEQQALFLSLHGASVEAINQSGSYYPKTWGTIVAPTNRRPYGFNWEEWGRMDALEVLDLVKKEFPIDESRIYLTGHSMGGHGTWHLGALYPDQFAAIGPSAGWISFWTYRFRGMNLHDTTRMRMMLRRSTNTSETFLHLGNYRQLGVYILHGSNDDNVPTEESRVMAETLRSIHSDFAYHEEPGAGHWWDKSDEPGADCVDWAPMFDFFARHRRPSEREVRDIDFSTANPEVSSTDYWLQIDAQLHQLEMSNVRIRFDPVMRRFIGTTSNVYRLALDLSIISSRDTVTVVLDGQTVRVLPNGSQGTRLWLEMDAGKWMVGQPPSDNEKNSIRYGTFKAVFANDVILVFGTHGSRDENRWAFDKARYDAEKLWYQGNSSLDVIADDQYSKKKYDGRNVILYGNRNTNSAWPRLLGTSPVQVFRQSISIGEKKFYGTNLSCIFVRPIAGSQRGVVAAISGTGLEGMMVNNRLPYLSPGIGLPDCTVQSSEILVQGDNGLILTGFFGLDWSVGGGEFVGLGER